MSKNSEYELVKFAKLLGKTTDKLKFWEMFQFIEWLSTGKLPEKKVKMTRVKKPRRDLGDIALAKILAAD